MTLNRQKVIVDEKYFLPLTYTVCFTDKDLGRMVIIFESILTNFILSVVYRGHRGSRVKMAQNWLKIEAPSANFACLNW
jgi:hypothetical protein